MALEAERAAVLAAMRAEIETAPRIGAKRGKHHAHDWQQWGDDEKYERCAVCGAARALAVKQGGLFG